ncbi:hypothetical protein CAPTEDRAFT_229066 [Capitella teleta]|uniref:Macro domain-containing protein n=1 Tax=Capitella teleta TaxID=283909 RepID=X2B1B6_CAPTE|nr:hypothetical protein CAPTEDRAFT_229066 [Capitella teleta]|eukprot:ELU00298.1 hypothetical protein CAPTEDRAFT_229066 [Capitella teleta]
MDPLGAFAPLVAAANLPRWKDTQFPYYDIMVDDPSEKRISPFKWSDEINQKVVLWSGDITELDTEAIVNSTNETINDKHPQSVKLMKAGGSDLAKDVEANVKACRTGEAKLTRGYKLPARYVIHTVGPRYNIKYRTAAESTLYNSYRSLLALVRENNIRSLGVSCVHTARRGYPLAEGAHIAIRTLRRFLEKFGSDIDLIVFVVTGKDLEVYNSLLPLYFPRSQSEEDFAAYHLPEDIGNEDGEPVIAERRIRISGDPVLESPRQPSAAAGGGFEESVTISEAFQTSVAIGSHSFSKMELDFDKERKTRLKHFSSQEKSLNSRNERYAQWLDCAKLTDHSSMQALRCLYQSGFDKHGRAVVVFLAKNYPASSVNLDKAILFFIEVLDCIVDHPYVFVYFNSMSTRDNHHSMNLVKDVYSLVDSRYVDNLAGLYIMHPTLWSKMLTWWITTFSLSLLKPKVYNIPGLEYLYSRIAPDQLDLPPYVLEHDIKVNGTRYYDPDQDAAIGAL